MTIEYASPVKLRITIEYPSPVKLRMTIQYPASFAPYRIFLLKYLAMKTKKAIIFDMDGVVIDSEALHERAGRMAFSHYGLSVDDAIFAQFKGKTDRGIVTYVVEQDGASGATVDDVLEMKRQNYAALIDELQPIPGALSFLPRVKESYRLALTTSASRRNKELAFQKFLLDGFFEVVVTSNDITKPKPDPEPYLVTVERLLLSPADCIVIEDSTNGVRSAVGAGCHVVGITTSFESDLLREAGAHVVVDSYEELAAMV